MNIQYIFNTMNIMNYFLRVTEFEESNHDDKSVGGTGERY